MRCIVRMPLLSQTLPSSLCLAGSSSPSSICFLPPGRETSWWGCQRLPQWGRVCRTEPCQCAIGRAAHCVSHLSALWACVCAEKSKREGTVLTLQSVQQTWMEPAPLVGSLTLLEEFFDQSYQRISTYQGAPAWSLDLHPLLETGHPWRSHLGHAHVPSLITQGGG